jgi:hypothetical protein
MVRPWSTFGTVMDLAKTAKICDRTKTAQKTRGRTWMYNIPILFLSCSNSYSL